MIPPFKYPFLGGFSPLKWYIMVYHGISHCIPMCIFWFTKASSPALASALLLWCPRARGIFHLLRGSRVKSPSKHSIFGRKMNINH